MQWMTIKTSWWRLREEKWRGGRTKRFAFLYIQNILRWSEMWNKKVTVDYVNNATYGDRARLPVNSSSQAVLPSRRLCLRQTTCGKPALRWPSSNQLRLLGEMLIQIFDRSRESLSHRSLLVLFLNWQQRSRKSQSTRVIIDLWPRKSNVIISVGSLGYKLTVSDRKTRELSNLKPITSNSERLTSAMYREKWSHHGTYSRKRPSVFMNKDESMMERNLFWPSTWHCRFRCFFIVHSRESKPRFLSRSRPSSPKRINRTLHCSKMRMTRRNSAL